MGVTREELLQQGWRIAEDRGFPAIAGPIWVKGEKPNPRFGILVEPQHLNAGGVTHGGVTSFFADIALGRTGVARLDGRRTVTIQLNLHYVSAAKEGDFIEADVDVVRITQSVVFLRGKLLTGDKTIAAADGIWKIL